MSSLLLLPTPSLPIAVWSRCYKGTWKVKSFQLLKHHSICWCRILPSTIKGRCHTKKRFICSNDSRPLTRAVPSNTIALPPTLQYVVSGG
ncbi:hypothetical protein DFS33DRAFT_1342211 [Desarmillaria ectypa]|nr:hypothetical protein DFS33DRAFT_1342211 [Desarmillaria ectypa]